MALLNSLGKIQCSVFNFKKKIKPALNQLFWPMPVENEILKNAFRFLFIHPGHLSQRSVLVDTSWTFKGTVHHLWTYAHFNERVLTFSGFSSVIL